jgi:hypothetical protein
MPKIARPTKPLADVNVLPQPDGSHEIVICIMPDPDSLVGEGNSKAFMALDASRSLKEMYGEQGPFMSKPNYVEAVARKIGAMLTDMSRSGNVPGFYWAVSPDGSKTEYIGEYDANGWLEADVSGPKKERWGGGTRLLPAIQYAVDEITRDSDWTLGVIMTDGIIEDEEATIEYCLNLAREMDKGQRKTLKLILIGIGEEVDEGQLERFDDMTEGTDVEYDLWSHGMVASMKDEADIINVLYGELATEEQIIAPSGHIEDGSGNQIQSWSDGLPAKFRFVLPKGQSKFILRVPGHDVEQDVSEAIG